MTILRPAPIFIVILWHVHYHATIIWYAMLWYDVTCCPIPNHTMPCHTAPCHTVLRCNIPPNTNVPTSDEGYVSLSLSFDIHMRHIYARECIACICTSHVLHVHMLISGGHLVSVSASVSMSVRVNVNLSTRISFGADVSLGGGASGGVCVSLGLGASLVFF